MIYLLSKKLCMDDTLDAILDTLTTTVCQSRPPEPVEEVRSSKKSSQDPMTSAADMDTEGSDNSSGVTILRASDFEVFHERHKTSVLVHLALSMSLLSVILSPIFNFESLGNCMETKLSSFQVQRDIVDIGNANRYEQLKEVS